MINLTILSLSTPYLLSPSPFLANNIIFVQKSFFKNFFPTLFYNPYAFQVQSSSFSHGLGALVYMKNEDNIPKPTLTPEPTPKAFKYENKNYNDADQPIHHYDKKCLCIIIECHFIGIALPDNNIDGFIDVKQDSTFYLTSCVFDSCSTQKSTFIDLHTRAIQFLIFVHLIYMEK